MIDNQITSLAREHAKIACPEFAYKGDKELRNDDIKGETISIEAFLRFLLRRFCLIEKSKVEEVYKNTKSYKSELEPFSRQSDCCSVKLRLLESLFPDLGKEVEE